MQRVSNVESEEYVRNVTYTSEPDRLPWTASPVCDLICEFRKDPNMYAISFRCNETVPIVCEGEPYFPNSLLNSLYMRYN